jgi:hypothetical protein
MTFQYSVPVRNAALDVKETTIGPSAVLKVFSGAEPLDCTLADPTGLLVTMALPADWMNPASGGVKTKSGTWSGIASGAGIAASWRIYDAALVAPCIQGNTIDMTFDNTTIAIGQLVTVNSFTLTAGNA